MMPGRKQDCSAGRLGLVKVAHRYTTNEQCKICHLIVVVFLGFLSEIHFKKKKKKKA